MKKLNVLLLLISSLLIVSCESNTYQELTEVVNNPTYEANIKTIMTDNCIGCHSSGDQYPNLETYDEVKDACENGEVICRIEGTCGEIMPTSGPMPEELINQIKLWSTTGYLNQ